MLIMIIDDEKLLGVSQSVFREGGFGPHSFHFGFRSVLIKIYLGKPLLLERSRFALPECYLHFCYEFLF